MSLNKVITEVKTGNEPLTLNNKPIGPRLIDFWKWSVSDLLSNATRGRLAEFIVATAIDISKTAVRDEWSAYDLETIDGIKIEIKSAAYVQSWFQNSLSKIQFSIKPAYFWDSETSKYSDEKKRHADVYVFCLLHYEDKTTIDPLNLDHWEFYVVPTKQLDGYTRSQHSITLKSLKNLTYAVSYAMLRDTINKNI